MEPCARQRFGAAKQIASAHVAFFTDLITTGINGTAGALSRCISENVMYKPSVLLVTDIGHCKRKCWKAAVTRTRTDPKRIHDEYQKWLQFKIDTGRDDDLWYPGKWDRLYATEVECQEQAVKMADHFRSTVSTHCEGAR